MHYPPATQCPEKLEEKEDRVVETGSEMNGLLVLSNAGELHSYIDLPERHKCPAFGQNILHPDNISCTGENVLHLLPDSIDGWCCERWIGSIGDEWFDLNRCLK